MGYNPPYYISAYSLAVKAGFNGTKEEWLASLVGPKGDEGLSAYEVAVAGGFEGTEDEWLASLVGPIGPPGAAGEPGKTFRVTISGYPWAADKSFTEIYAAHEAGQAVECVLSNGEVLVLFGVTAEAAIFQNINNRQYSRIAIKADDAVTFTTGQYALQEDLPDASAGGYYTPEVRDNGDGSMEVFFTPSDADMPAVEPTTIKLPAGKGISGVRLSVTEYDRVIFNIDFTDGNSNTISWDRGTPVKGVDYWTEEDKAEMVADVLAALEASEEVAV